MASLDNNMTITFKVDEKAFSETMARLDAMIEKANELKIAHENLLQRLARKVFKLSP